VGGGQALALPVLDAVVRRANAAASETAAAAAETAAAAAEMAAAAAAAGTAAAAAETAGAAAETAAAAVAAAVDASSAASVRTNENVVAAASSGSHGDRGGSWAAGEGHAAYFQRWPPQRRPARTVPGLALGQAVSALEAAAVAAAERDVRLGDALEVATVTAPVASGRPVLSKKEVSFPLKNH
jgi:hypothetical protein